MIRSCVFPPGLSAEASDTDVDQEENRTVGVEDGLVVSAVTVDENDTACDVYTVPLVARLVILQAHIS